MLTFNRFEDKELSLSKFRFLVKYLYNLFITLIKKKDRVVYSVIHHNYLLAVMFLLNKLLGISEVTSDTTSDKIKIPRNNLYFLNGGCVSNEVINK